MDDDRAIYGVLLLAGAMPVIGAVVRGGAVGAGITLAFGMMVVGAVGLVRGARRASARLPQARLARRSRTP